MLALILIMLVSAEVRLFGYYDSTGVPRWSFLRNIDSYYYLRYIDMTLENNGVLPSIDIYKQSPNGEAIGYQHMFYSYLGAYSYLALGKPFGQTLPEFLAWFPVLLSSLIVIPVYYLGKYLYDKKAGVFASIFAVLALPFMSRSLGGDPDSDAIVMLLFFTALALFWAAKAVIGRPKRVIALTVGFGLSVAAFALTWTGFWFPVWIIGAFLVLKTLVTLLRTRNIRQTFHNVKWLWGILFGAWAVFAVVLLPVAGLSSITLPATQGTNFFSVYKVESTMMFPNVDVSVAEAQAGSSIQNIISDASGIGAASQITGMPFVLMMLISPFLLMLGCFAYLMYAYYKRREGLDTLFFVGILFVVFMFASVTAARGNMFLAPIIGLCAGIMLSKLWEWARK